MPQHINVAGTWKDSTVWINVAGTWKKAAVWQNVAGVWKQITALLSSLMPSTASGYDWTITPTNAYAIMELNASGAYSATYGSSGTWRGGGTSSEYEAYWTTTSGTLNGGTAGAWLNLGTTRQWTAARTTLGVNTLVGTLQIRMAASPYTVFSTTTVTLTATKESDL